MLLYVTIWKTLHPHRSMESLRFDFTVTPHLVPFQTLPMIFPKQKWSTIAQFFKKGIIEVYSIRIDNFSCLVHGTPGRAVNEPNEHEQSLFHVRSFNLTEQTNGHERQTNKIFCVHVRSLRNLFVRVRLCSFIKS